MMKSTLRVLNWWLVIVGLCLVWMPARSSAQSSKSASSARAPKPDARSEVLSLEQAIDRAVELNTRMRSARIDESIARRNASLGNAGFLPRFDAVGTQRHQFGGSGLFGSGAIFTQTEAGLQLSWTVVDGLGRFETYDRLQAERREQSLRTRVEIESVVREVTEAYIQLQRARGVLAALKETRNLSETRLEISRARLEAGTGSKVDVNQARVELNGDRSAIATQRITVREAKARLVRVMGRRPGRAFSVTGEIQVNRELNRGDIREQVFEQNHELRAARASQEVREEELAEQKARRWPQLDVGLGYTYTEFHSGVAPEFDSTAALAYNLQLTVPIFRGFNIRRSIRNARSRVAKEEFAVHRQRLTLIERFEQAWTSYQRHTRRIELAEESVELAQDNVEVALTQFEAGTIDQVQLRQVQVNLQEARTRLVEARFAARFAELRLRDLAGQLYERAVR